MKLIKSNPKGSKIQSVIFSKKYFTLTQAKSWARSHNFIVVKIDKTKTEYRIRQYPPAHLKIVGQKKFGKGVRALIALPAKGYTF